MLLLTVLNSYNTSTFMRAQTQPSHNQRHKLFIIFLQPSPLVFPLWVKLLIVYLHGWAASCMFYTHASWFYEHFFQSVSGCIGSRSSRNDSECSVNAQWAGWGVQSFYNSCCCCCCLCVGDDKQAGQSEAGSSWLTPYSWSISSGLSRKSGYPVITIMCFSCGRRRRRVVRLREKEKHLLQCYPAFPHTN